MTQHSPIVIQPEQLHLEKLTACDGTKAHVVQPLKRTTIPGVKTPSKGIGSGHHQIRDMCQNNVESNFFD